MTLFFSISRIQQKPFTSIPVLDIKDDRAWNPIIGSAVTMTQNPKNFLSLVSKRQTPIIRYRLGFDDHVIISDPKMLGEIYRREKKANSQQINSDNSVRKGFLNEQIKNVTGVNSVFTSPVTPEWKKYRKPLDRGLHKKIIQNSISQIWQLVIEELRELKQAIETDEISSISFSKLANEISLKVTYHLVFGLKNTNINHIKKVSEDWSNLQHEGVQIAKQPFPMIANTLQNFGFPLDTEAIVNSMGSFEYQRISKFLFAEVDRIYAERAKLPPGLDPLYGIIVSAESSNCSPKVIKKRICDEIKTLLIAGHETTARTLEWIFHFLSLKKYEVFKNLLENETVLIKNWLSQNYTPSIDDLKKLKNINSAVYETIRVEPVLYFFGRKLNKSMIVGGYKIPANTIIVISPWVQNRYQRLWKGSPKEFYPGRFITSAKQLGFDSDIWEYVSYLTREYRFIPFGTGQHACPGQHLAKIELSIVLGLFQAMFDYDMVDERKLPGMGGLTNSVGTEIYLKNIRTKI